MKPGQVVEGFDVKDKEGEKHEVIFRLPRKSDVKAALRLVNTVRDEAQFLDNRHHETMKSEKEFIGKQIKNLKQRKGIFLFIEVDGVLAGDAEIHPIEFDVSPHVGNFGIMLKEEFTGMGIGTRLMRRMLQLARDKTNFKIIESSYFAKNKRSKKLHKKFGFKQYDRFPKECRLKDGSYCDHIYVYKVIKKL